MLRDDERWEQLMADWRAAPLSGRERAICDFAELLTRSPHAASKDEAHVPLRAAGLDDEAVLHLVEVVAYFNFVNRLAEGAGVELEEQYR